MKPKVLAGVVTCLLMVAIIPAAIDRPTYEPAFGADGWEVAQNFFSNARPAEGDLPATILESADVQFWHNNSDQQKILAGEVRSRPFTLRRADLIIPLIGHPESAAAGVLIETVVEQRRFRVQSTSSPSQAQSLPVRLPPAWVGQSVRIIAFSKQPGVHIGIGTPYYRTNRAVPGTAFANVLGPTLAAMACLLLTFFPAYLLAGKMGAAGVERLVLALLLSALGALVLFFVAFYWPAIGRWLALTWLILSAGLLAWQGLIRRVGASFGRSGQLCLVLVVGSTVFHALFLFSFQTLSITYAANDLFYPAAWSTDNAIPPATAQLLAKGSLATEWGFGTWRPSDRTPLLAALLYPAAVALRESGPWPGGAESMILQIASFGIANSWMPVVWLLFARLGLTERQCILGILLVAGTPFVFFNTIYIWPKLLSATFCLILCDATLKMADDESGQRTWQALIAGSAGGLAIMSHSAAAVSVAAIFGTAALLLARRQWRYLAWAAAATALVVLPWIFWTKYSMPTTYPLPKFLLTGDFGWATGKESVADAVLRTYQSLTPGRWLDAKLTALKTLCGLELAQARGLIGRGDDPFSGLRAIRGYQFFFLLPALGLLTIPLFAVFLPRRDDPAPGETSGRTMRLLVWALVVTLVLQFTVMLAPHFLHHYPYFLALGLHVLAVSVVLRRPSRLFQVVALTNYALFIFCWIFLTARTSPLGSIAGLTCWMVMLAAASSLIVCLLFRDKAHQTR